MRTLFVALVSAAMALGACDSGPDAGPVALNLKLSGGEKIRQWTVTEQTIGQHVANSWQDVRQSIGIGTTYEVEEIVGDTLLRMRVTYDSVTVEQTGVGEDVHYNSADTVPNVPPLAAGYAAMLGQSFTLVMGTDGHVRRVVGLDSVLRNIVDRVVQSNPAARSMIEEGMKSLLSEQSLTETMERSIAIYPEGPVSTGDTWSKVVSVTVGTPMTISTTYTLGDISDGMANVDLNASITTNAAAGPTELAGMSIDYQISGTQTGSMQIDVSDGWIASSEIVQDVTGTMRLGALDSSVSVPSSAIPLRMHSRITTRSWEQ